MQQEYDTHLKCKCCRSQMTEQHWVYSLQQVTLLLGWPKWTIIYDVERQVQMQQEHDTCLKCKCCSNRANQNNLTKVDYKSDQICCTGNNST